MRVTRGPPIPSAAQGTKLTDTECYRKSRASTVMPLGLQRDTNNPDTKSCRRAGLSRVDWAEDHIIAALESLSGPTSCPICRSVPPSLP
ncbi:hypothetical protein CSPX01_09915 [Colletotrichum filicis]|nr:hypothetical protein CSPX01_09915 [Colletotrichum filicis]